MLSWYSVMKSWDAESAVFCGKGKSCQAALENKAGNKKRAPKGALTIFNILIISIYSFLV